MQLVQQACFVRMDHHATAYRKWVNVQEVLQGMAVYVCCGPVSLGWLCQKRAQVGTSHNRQLQAFTHSSLPLSVALFGHTAVRQDVPGWPHVHVL